MYSSIQNDSLQDIQGDNRSNTECLKERERGREGGSERSRKKGEVGMEGKTDGGREKGRKGRRERELINDCHNYHVQCRTSKADPELSTTYLKLGAHQDAEATQSL